MPHELCYLRGFLFLKLSSFIQDSFQEFDGLYSLVLFSQGCNLNCPGCYNKGVHSKENYSAIEVLKEKINPLHEGVVFLGGEPTLWDDLPQLIGYVKDKGIKVKVYTNGLRPEVTKEIVKDTDSFSIDLKTLLDDKNVLGVDFKDYLTKVTESIRIILDNNKKLEVRTTKWKGVNHEEIIKFMKNNFPMVKHIIQEDFLGGNY